jgi:hypothetical protein
LSVVSCNNFAVILHYLVGKQPIPGELCQIKSGQFSFPRRQKVQGAQGTRAPVAREGRCFSGDLDQVAYIARFFFLCSSRHLSFLTCLVCERHDPEDNCGWQTRTSCSSTGALCPTGLKSWLGSTTSRQYAAARAQPETARAIFGSMREWGSATIFPGVQKRKAFEARELRWRVKAGVLNAHFPLSLSLGCCGAVDH